MHDYDRSALRGASVADVFTKTDVKDPINHPDHYKASGLEAIDVIEAFGLNYRLGNVIKYVLRAGKKDPARRLEDLKKARWYLDREIERG